MPPMRSPADTEGIGEAWEGMGVAGVDFGVDLPPKSYPIRIQRIKKPLVFKGFSVAAVGVEPTYSPS